jgi:hypothetical protein
VAGEVSALRSRASEAQAAAAAAEGSSRAARRDAAQATSLREQTEAELGAALELQAARASQAEERASRAASDRAAAQAAAVEAVASTERLLSEMEATVRSTSARCDALSELQAAAELDAAVVRARARTDALRVEAGVLGIQAASLRRYAGAWVNRAHRSAAATAAFRQLCSLMPHLCGMVHAPGTSGKSEVPRGAGGSGGQAAAGGSENAGEGLFGTEAEMAALMRDHLALVAGWQRLAAIVQPMPSHWRLPSRAAETLARACEDQREMALALADLAKSPHARPERTRFFNPHTRSAEVAAGLESAAAELRKQLGAPYTALEWLLGAAATAGRPAALPTPDPVSDAAAVGAPARHGGPGVVRRAGEEKEGNQVMQEPVAAVQGPEEAERAGALVVAAPEEAASEEQVALGEDAGLGAEAGVDYDVDGVAVAQWAQAPPEGAEEEAPAEDDRG